MFLSKTECKFRHRSSFKLFNPKHCSKVYSLKSTHFCVYVGCVLVVCGIVMCDSNSRNSPSRGLLGIAFEMKSCGYLV